MATTTRFEPVLCETCSGFGRSITLYQRDHYGNLYFVGKLLDTAKYDVRLHALVFGCRVCASPVVIPLTECARLVAS